MSTVYASRLELHHDVSNGSMTFAVVCNMLRVQDRSCAM